MSVRWGLEANFCSYWREVRLQKFFLSGYLSGFIYLLFICLFDTKPFQDA